MSSHRWFMIAAVLCSTAACAQSLISDVRVDGARLVDRGVTAHPLSAWRAGAVGVVTVEVNIGVDGEVTNARAVAGPEELRRAVQPMVLGWRFDKGRKTARVHITFRRPSEIGIAAGGKVTFAISDKLPAAARLRKLEGLQFDHRLLTRIVAAMEPMTSLRIDQQQLVTGQSATTVFGEPSNNPAITFTKPFGRPSQPPRVLRPGGNARIGSLVEKADPVYPPLAREARIQGIVRLNITIDTDGTVSRANVVSGHPLLVPAALDAIRKYRYRRTLMSGVPVAIITQIDIEFKSP